MNFLAPLFLLGALAVAGPIVYHLIRQTTRQRQVFSSLMFLKPTPPRVTRRSRLEHVGLLLLRCLVLGLLAMAFARPFFREQAPVSAPVSEARRVVVLVDRSASMQRSGLWSAAQKAAERRLRQLSPEDRVSIWLFDTALSSVMSFEAWSAAGAEERIAIARSRLAAAQPGWVATDLGQALTAAAEILDEAGDRGAASESYQREILVISDFQEGARLAALQAYEWPRDVRVTIERLPGTPSGNAGISLLAAVDAQAGNASSNIVRYRIGNASDSKRDLFEVRWKNALTGTNAVESYVPAGQSRVATISGGLAGGTSGALVLSGDGEPFDNTAWWVADAVQRARVIYLGDDNEKDPGQGLFYLKRALGETRRQKIEVLARGAATPLMPGELTAAALVVISDKLAASHAVEVMRFLQSGGHVLLVVRTSAASETMARLTGRDPVPVIESSVRDYALLGQVDFRHPLLAPFADPRFSDFTRIHFWKHRDVDLRPLGDAARVLASFDRGAPALVEIRVGQGQLLMLASGWEPADSQLALSSKFVPLLLSMLSLSDSLRAVPTRYQVGDAVPVFNLEGMPESSSATVRKPDGTSVSVARGQPFGETDQPGLYAVTSVSPAWHFAVNLVPEETRTGALDPDELIRLGVPMKPVGIPSPARLAETRNRADNVDRENRQKLWRWLIAAALAVIAVETWLAGRLHRRKSMAPVHS